MFAKIFEQIYDSSIAEDWKSRIVFQDMLILSDKHGIVDKTPESIARRTNLPIEIVLEAIPKLEAPDKSSRTPDQDGRRIVRLDAHRDWGWRIVNFEKYRESATKEMLRMCEADRKRNYRDRQRRTPSPAPPSPNAEAEGQKQTSPGTCPGHSETSNATKPCKTGLESPPISTAERITYEQSLRRVLAELERLVGADLPKSIKRRDFLNGEKKRLMNVLGVNV